jgi:2-polyprenyl-6-methoxyphenol hydroxylase-like FAD-dependent oxidoreductase
VKQQELGLRILIIGGGIGGLTAAIALRQRGFDVDLLEKNPPLTVYGVGIIQQANVIRAFGQLGILDEYVTAGFGFDHVYVFLGSGDLVAKVPAPRLVAGYSANLGISRRSLHQVLTNTATRLGAHLQFGLTATRLENTGDHVVAHFEQQPPKTYDLVIAADGINSSTREAVFPEAPKPEYTGQAVWRYNFARPQEIDGICTYMGPTGVGLVPLSRDEMYMFVTTAEPDDRRPPHDGLAASMRARLEGTAPAIQALASQITDDDAVVYRPLEWLLLRGPWHRGRIVFLGDAVHATTPHLGQGAGMAIEDALVLADELATAETVEEACTAYHARRFERCEYIVEKSKAICYGQLGKGPLIDHAKATGEMFEVIAKPI